MEDKSTNMYQLTDVAVRKAKPGAKPKKLTDGHGLYLHIAPSGGKLWRFTYRFGGKQKLIALGAYPDVALAQARERHGAARKLLADGIDPMEQRKAERAKQKARSTTFEDVFNAWYEKWSEGKDERHAEQVKRRVEGDVLPAFGDKPVDEVDADDVRQMVVAVHGRGAEDVARRAHAMVSQIYGFAVAHRMAKRNPAADFKFSHLQLPKAKPKNFARIDARQLPTLLKKTDEYNGTAVTKLAMRLLALTFVRTSELIEAPWSEFDLENARWDIPKERMKMPTPHIVPLSRQAVEVLRALKLLTGTHSLVFPGDLDKDTPMNKNTILKALERMGYKGLMTGHGWRGIASTVLHENDFDDEWIELQLAHMPRNEIAAAYNYAKYLKQRTKMMRWWADYLDEQRQKAQ
jgi:integrase